MNEPCDIGGESVVRVNREGSYRFIVGVLQYSAGVAAERGFVIERARLASPLPLKTGFEAIRQQLQEHGRPPTALCACELRSPRPFTEDGFAAFNARYASILKDSGVIDGVLNPVARTNVCLELDDSTQVMVHAFSYTVPAERDAGPSFVIAGSAEAPEGRGSYRPHVIRLGDQSQAGLREKVRWVVGEITRRIELLGMHWDQAAETNVYTSRNVDAVLADELGHHSDVSRGLARHYCRPPLEDLDFEMDVRCVAREILLRPT